jgi:hypothetical protein
MRYEPGADGPLLGSRRVRRNRAFWGAGPLAPILLAYLVGSGHGSSRGAAPRPGLRSRTAAWAPQPPSRTAWIPIGVGDGRPVTFAFGGDVHFPAGTPLEERLAADPTTPLLSTVPQFAAGANITMAHFELALTDETCPDSQSKQDVFNAPVTALSAFQHAGVALITEANNHGEDFGPEGLQIVLQARQQ